MATMTGRPQRTSSFEHAALRSVLANPERLRRLSSTERDELLRRLRELDALEERAMDAYAQGNFALAERLDEAYAIKAEELEGLEGELAESIEVDEREPGELDVGPSGRLGPGRLAPPVEEDLTGALSALYERYLAVSEDPEAYARHAWGWDFDPEHVRDVWPEDQIGFPMQTMEDALALHTRRLIESRMGGSLAHVPPSELVEAAQDSFARRSSLRERYREAQERRLVGNRRNHALPRTQAIFDDLMDELDVSPFDDLGWIHLASDERAGEGGERQFAFCQAHNDGRLTVAFAPKVEKLPDSHILGLMAHELGHAIDFRYPRSVVCERLELHGLPKGAERRADVIAEHVFGFPIEYDEDDIQCVGCGGRSPRPSYLRQNPEGAAAVEFGRLSVLPLGTRGTVVYEDEHGQRQEQPVEYRVRPYSDDDYLVEARVPDDAPPPPKARHTGIDAGMWPRIGSVGVENRDYDYAGPRGVMAVYGSGVNAALRRQGVGTHLYEIAADVACFVYRRPFASDTSRSWEADKRWRSLGGELEDVGDYSDEHGGGDFYVLECTSQPMSDFVLPRRAARVRVKRRRRRSRR